MDMALYQDNCLIDKIQYLVAYIWIIGVILYVLFEPILCEIKENCFRVKQSEIVNAKKPSVKKKHSP